MIFERGRNKGNLTLVVIMKFWECDSRLGLLGLGCRLCYLSWAWKYDHSADGSLTWLGWYTSYRIPANPKNVETVLEGGVLGNPLGWTITQAAIY